MHPSSEQVLRRMAVKLPHAVLLTGQHGVGLFTIAKMVAGTALTATLEPRDAKGQPSEDGTITVEMVRGLYDQTRGKQTSMRVIVVDNADHMSHSAQSAFLKLLEEPSPHTHFLLTAHTPQQLLPTIRSRVQMVPIHPATKTQSIEHLAELGIKDDAKKTQLLFIASGLPAELTRLARDEEYFRVRAQVMGDARDFLTGDRYKKMLVIQKYRSDRNQAIRLLDSMLMVLRGSISAKPQTALLRQLDSLLQVRELLLANHNVSLQLARLAV